MTTQLQGSTELADLVKVIEQRIYAYRRQNDDVLGCLGWSATRALTGNPVLAESSPIGEWQSCMYPGRSDLPEYVQMPADAIWTPWRWLNHALGPDYSGLSELPLLTEAAWRTAAGFPSTGTPWRALFAAEKAWRWWQLPGDDFHRRLMRRWDIIGEWIFEDLRSGLSPLRWTIDSIPVDPDGWDLIDNYRWGAGSGASRAAAIANAEAAATSSHFDWAPCDMASVSQNGGGDWEAIFVKCFRTKKTSRIVPDWIPGGMVLDWYARAMAPYIEHSSGYPTPTATFDALGTDLLQDQFARVAADCDAETEIQFGPALGSVVAWPAGTGTGCRGWQVDQPTMESLNLLAAVCKWTFDDLE